MQGEQKVTSGSAMPDGYEPEERLNEYGLRGARYGKQALEAGVQLDPRVLYEGIDQLTDGELHRVDSAVRGNVENTRQNVEDTVSDIQQGMEIAKQKAEGLQREAGESAWALAKQIPAVIEGVKKTIPHPEPTPQESQNPQPAWPETPVPQMPKVPLLQGYNPQNIPPAIKMPGDLSRPEPAPIKMPARIEAEGQLPPASLIPPNILPKPADLQTHIEKAVTRPIIDQLQLPTAGSALKNPPTFGAGQGGDYDGVESLIPILPGQKPAPMLPPKSIDPGFLAPAPPENIDPGFRAPDSPEDLIPIEEREPLMV